MIGQAIFRSVSRASAREGGRDCHPFRDRTRPAIASEFPMSHHSQKLSASPPTRWDQHCRLVIQFPISLRSQVRVSARFNGVKLELRPNLDRGAPHREREFFLHPAMLPLAFGFGPSKPEVRPLSAAAIPV